MIIDRNQKLREDYHKLKCGDKIITTLNLKKTEELIFIDLLERNIKIFPSALSQALTRSKCLQAAILKTWMIPNTFVVNDKNDLPQIINHYSKNKIDKIVTKLDRKNCGIGVNLWNSIEELNNCVMYGNDNVFPFVVQPFLPDAVDVRVIAIGDYIEAYWRKNYSNFRNNISLGGESGEYELTNSQIKMCREIMERGKFPYAHIDLLISERKSYLSEISLRGGIKGAKITPQEYLRKINEIEEKFKNDG